MTKSDLLEIVKTLSAVESLLMSINEQKTVPDYLFERIAQHCEAIEKEILS